MSTTLTAAEVLTLEEAADFLRVATPVLQRLADQESIPARQIDGELRFLKSALEAWLINSNSRAALLEQVGALSDDETLASLRDEIYAGRGRSETE